ncbi:MAG TPA: RimK family alpha-L-glutamate ligase [Pyrodictium sp.]|nr:RimK family alpha-L-glutamate ligase [Pyrodictium sp.]
MTTMVLAYDYIREEEKRIIRAAKNANVRLTLCNLLESPLDYFDKWDVDAAIIRPVSMFNAVYAASYFESMKVLTVNPSYTILYAGDKILTYSLLRSANIPIPRTILSLGDDSLHVAAKRLGFPLVDKPPIGSWGRLVSLVENERQLIAIAEHRAMLPSKQFRAHILQEYIATANTDIRCLMIDDEVLGCIKRIARKGEWRSNVALGARVEPYKPDSELVELVYKALAVFKGMFLSIDIFEHRENGYLVNEVNGVPEFKGFIRATGIRVEEVLINKILEKLRR